MDAKRTARAAVALAVVLLATGVVSAQADDTRSSTTFKVVAHLSTHSVRVNHPVTVSGSVTPVRPGKRVFVKQERRNGMWTTIGSAKLNGAGDYSFSVRPTQSGRLSYRVVKLREGTIGRGASLTRSLTSSRWFALDQLVITPSDQFLLGSVTINGAQFTRSIYAALPILSQASADVELSGRCSTVKGTMGLSDNSSSSAEAEIKLSVDGTTGPDFLFFQGGSKAFSIDVTGHSALGVDMVSQVDKAAYPAIGDGLALCSFRRAPVV